MTFSIYALLSDESPAVSSESLAAHIEKFFRKEEGFSWQFEQLPFAKTKTIALRWGSWLVRVAYEEGKNVLQDSADIAKIVGAAVPAGVADIGRRIRVVFSDDDGQKYTNQIIFVMDFLRDIPGAIVFDPQQKDLIKS